MVRGSESLRFALLGHELGLGVGFLIIVLAGGRRPQRGGGRNFRLSGPPPHFLVRWREADLDPFRSSLIANTSSSTKRVRP